MKISRNDYCPCGSGKKYKNCHWGKEDPIIPTRHPAPAPASDAHDLDDLDPAKADVMSPGYWEKMSKRLPRDMRQEFGPMIAQVKQYAEVESRREQIEAAAQALEAHRAEYAKLTKNTSELLRRAEKLFAEPPFEAMRFRAADVQRAFESVGYPPAGPIGKRFTTIVDKAVRFLLDDKQRESMAQRLLLTLPKYVNAGRHMDAWIIRHSVDLTAEPPEGVVGPFLLAMFMHGFREWEEQRDQEQKGMFAKIGLDPEEIRRMGFEGLERWMRDTWSKPDKAAAMEKFLAEHPELNAMTQAQCRASEEAAQELLQREDAHVLLLTSEEVEPWLEILDRRLRNAPEGFASLSKAHPPDEAVAKAFVSLVYDVASEMAKSIFTSARLNQLKSQLHEWRRRLSAEGDSDALAGVHGALMAIQSQTALQDSRFLCSLCWASLRTEMDAMAGGLEEDAR